jgi:hypothetical protein
MAGPLVECRVVPISRARMWARVVLPRPRRAAEEDVIERLLAPARGLDEDLQVLLVLRLADVLVERVGAEQAVETIVVPCAGG